VHRRREGLPLSAGMANGGIQVADNIGLMEQ
jgi:hypothetical protein